MILHYLRPLLLATAAFALEPAFAAPPPAPVPVLDDSHVTVTLQTWTDPKRDNRQVLVAVYYDARPTTTPHPVIIVSHGLGGSRDAMKYLGRAWAAAGYVSVHLQHRGSDSDLWKNNANSTNAIKDAMNTDNVTNRSRDVQFAIDKLTEINERPGPFHHGLDLAHIGMAGHSFGAHTTLMIAGQSADLLNQKSSDRGLNEPRVTACLALSPAPPQLNTDAFLKKAYASIKVPIMHMTGTEDYSPIRDVKPADRRVPYDHIPYPDQYLVVFKNGDHGLFGGRQRIGLKASRDAEYQKLIILLSTRYWDAWLRNDASAMEWLKNAGAVQAQLGSSATFENKEGATAKAK